MSRRVTEGPGELWNKVVQALVTPETNERLIEKAERLGISRSEAGRRAIERYVESDQDEPAGNAA